MNKIPVTCNKDCGGGCPRGFMGHLVLYAPDRIFFDSLRVGDRTYLGYTPGQYFSVIITGIGIYLLVKGWKEKSRGKKRVES